MYSPESVLTFILSPAMTKAGTITVTPALDAAPHSARGAQFASWRFAHCHSGLDRGERAR